MLTRILNGGIDVLVLIATSVMGLLPDTPFNFEELSWGQFGTAIGFVFPISAMFMHMTAIVTAFFLYYAVRWLLRIVRQIQ